MDQFNYLLKQSEARSNPPLIVRMVVCPQNHLCNIIDCPHYSLHYPVKVSIWWTCDTLNSRGICDFDPQKKVVYCK